MHRDVESADRMLSRLSELLRLTLHKVGQQEVPLSEEIDFLAKYLQIEQTRFQDRLTVTVRRRGRGARRPGSAHAPAAARRERDQARHRAPARTGRDRDCRAPGRGHLLLEVARQRDGTLAGLPHRAAVRALACRRRGRGCSTCSAAITSSSSFASRGPDRPCGHPVAQRRAVGRTETSECCVGT